MEQHLRHILYIRRRDDVFLQTFVNSLDKNKFIISVLDLKNGLLIDYHNNLIKRINKNNSSRIINYFQRYLTGIVIFEYIEVYYNKKRLHSSLKYRTPDEVYFAK